MVKIHFRTISAQAHPLRVLIEGKYELALLKTAKGANARLSVTKRGWNGSHSIRACHGRFSDVLF